MEWSREAISAGVCTSLAVETYDREVERYGGAEALKIVERIFAIDSNSVVELLEALQTNPAVDRIQLAVRSMYDLLVGLRLNAASRERCCAQRRGAADAPAGELYRRTHEELRRLVGDSGWLACRPGGASLAGILDRRLARLLAVSEVLRSLPAIATRSDTLHEISRSLLHMHANRFLGVERSRELLALGLLRRTLHSLARAPFHADNAESSVGGQ